MDKRRNQTLAGKAILDAKPHGLLGIIQQTI